MTLIWVWQVSCWVDEGGSRGVFSRAGEKERIQQRTHGNVFVGVGLLISRYPRRHGIVRFYVGTRLWQGSHFWGLFFSVGRAPSHE